MVVVLILSAGSPSDITTHCECIQLIREKPPPSALDELAEHGTVAFVGRALQGRVLSGRSRDRLEFVFEVSESFNGADSSRIAIRTGTGVGGGDCAFGFRLDRVYLVYASPAVNHVDDDSYLSTSSCYGTAQVESRRARLELATLRREKEQRRR